MSGISIAVMVLAIVGAVVGCSWLIRGGKAEYRLMDRARNCHNNKFTRWIVLEERPNGPWPRVWTDVGVSGAAYDPHAAGAKDEAAEIMRAKMDRHRIENAPDTALPPPDRPMAEGATAGLALVPRPKTPEEHVAVVAAVLDDMIAKGDAQ